MEYFTDYEEFNGFVVRGFSTFAIFLLLPLWTRYNNGSDVKYRDVKTSGMNFSWILPFEVQEWGVLDIKRAWFGSDILQGYRNEYRNTDFWYYKFLQFGVRDSTFKPKYLFCRLIVKSVLNNIYV